MRDLLLRLLAIAVIGAGGGYLLTTEPALATVPACSCKSCAGATCTGECCITRGCECVCGPC